jgi:3-phosphoshikimate 1-carboxyvinyltransferase
MLAIISPGNIQGEVKIPASKSMMQRACAAALLHHGKTIIHNPGVSDDDKAALDIISKLGATIIHKEDRIEITSNGIQPLSNEIDCNESGLSARLFIPIASLAANSIQLTGKGSLQGRSMQTIADLLPLLGVEISHTEGKLPVTVHGPLKAKDITLDGSESSQFLSGLLFAYAYAAKEKVVITVTNLKSQPYIDLTLEVLQEFGKAIQHENHERFIIDPSSFTHQEEVDITIEGDWSAAANWLVAGAIAGDLTLKGLNVNSTQADKKILEVLNVAGVDVSIDNDSISVKKAFKILPFEFDATHCPDLFPPISTLATCARGECFIKGVHRLFGKESNRLVSIGDMLYGFGIFFSIEEDTLVTESRGIIDYATIDSYNDHRIVMAASIGSLRAKKPVLDVEAVNKSYPGFFRDLLSVGADCILKEE